MDTTGRSTFHEDLTVVTIWKVSRRRVGRRTGVCFVMRNLNAERAGMDVHLSSPAPVSVPSGYHKILKPVKESNRPHDLGGRWAATKVWER